MNKNACPVCGEQIYKFELDKKFESFHCPNCGKYSIENNVCEELAEEDYKFFSYLLYNKSRNKEIRWCAEKPKNCSDDDNIKYITMEDIDNWFPKTYSEKVDKILLYISNKSRHIGEKIVMNKLELASLSFVPIRFSDAHSHYIIDPYYDDKARYNSARWIFSKETLETLKSEDFIHYENNGKSYFSIQIQPKGYRRIDELQRNNAYNKKVFVAMQFKDRDNRYELIRDEIIAAGYEPIRIDEIPHNNYIVPEIMKEIRESKFVVADLTDGNQGAYFECGYAMGLGKEVIPIYVLTDEENKKIKEAQKIKEKCIERALTDEEIQKIREGEELEKKQPHFDLAQINMVNYKGEEENTPKLLKKRLKALED